MAKDSPSPPAAPNPYQTAAAQTGTNVNTAIANAWLGNANEVTPWGSVTYQPIGWHSVPGEGGSTNVAPASGGGSSGNFGNPQSDSFDRAGYFGANGNIGDPTMGGVGSGTQQSYSVPQFQRTVTLSPEQQRLYDQQNQLRGGLNDLALSQTARIGSILGSPLNMSGLPQGGEIPINGPRLNSLSLNQGFGDVGGLQRGVYQGVSPTGFDQAGNIQGSVNQTMTGNSVGYDTIGTGANQTMGPTSFGNAGNIQTGVNFQGLPTGFNAGGPIQGGVNFQNLAQGFTDSGALQRGMNFTTQPTGFGAADPLQMSVNQQLINGNLNDVGGVQRSVGPSDFSQDRMRVEQALFDRINPQLTQDRDALENRLVNQGLVRGTDAFRTAMDEANRQSNDARLAIVAQGGQEQQRMFDQLLAQGQFANTAQGQAFGQEQARGAFAAAAAAQNNQAFLNQAQFGSGQQAQQFAQAQARGQFNRDAIAANNADALAAGQFINAAQGQQFGQDQARAQFGRDAVNQNNANAFAAGQFANAAQGQQFAQNQAQADFGQNAINQNNANAFAAGQFANAAQGQQFAQEQARGQFAQAGVNQNNAANLAAANFGMNAINANNANALAAANFGLSANNANNQAALNAANFLNTAQGQQFAQNQARGAFAQAGVAQNNQAALAAANFANLAQGQAFDQARTGAQFQNDALTQQAQFNNQVGQQGFQNDLALAQARDAARERAIQEMLLPRNQAINEVSTLMNGGQMTMPQFSQFNAPQMNPADVQGAVYNSAAIQQQQYAQQMQQRNAMMGGLFGLGSAGIMGYFLSDRSMKEDVRDLGVRLMNGLKLYAFRYIGDPIQRVGVMAQDVERVVPEAVATFGGLKHVRYDLATRAV